MYQPAALAWVFASFIALCCAAFFSWRPSKEVHPLVLLAVLLVFLLLDALRAPGIYIEDPLYQHAAKIIFFILLVFSPLLYGTELRSFPQVRRVIFLIIVCVALLMRIAMPIASPAPAIDTFTNIQESAQNLLHGRDPFITVPTVDPYHGEGNFGYILRGYAYMPINLYLQTVAYFLTGDARFIYVLFDLLTAACLWLLARKFVNEIHADLLVLLFLFQPRSLFILEQAWVEPILTGFFALFLLLASSGRRNGMMITYGLFLSCKQYLLFFLVHWFLLERRMVRTVFMLGVALLTMLPFLVWHPLGFLQNGLLFQLEGAFRGDSLTIPSFLVPWIGETPKLWSIIVGFVVSLITFVLFRTKGLRGYIYAVSITTFSMFLFGSQAFCNYYGFVSVLIIFALTLDTEKASAYPVRS